MSQGSWRRRPTYRATYKWPAVSAGRLQDSKSQIIDFGQRFPWIFFPLPRKAIMSQEFWSAADHVILLGLKAKRHFSEMFISENQATTNLYCFFFLHVFLFPGTHSLPRTSPPLLRLSDKVTLITSLPSKSFVWIVCERNAVNGFIWKDGNTKGISTKKPILLGAFQTQPQAEGWKILSLDSLFPSLLSLENLPGTFLETLLFSNKGKSSARCHTTRTNLASK